LGFKKGKNAQNEWNAFCFQPFWKMTYKGNPYPNFLLKGGLDIYIYTLQSVVIVGTDYLDIYTLQSVVIVGTDHLDMSQWYRFLRVYFLYFIQFLLRLLMKYLENLFV
jgi:hypothetical protein